MKITVIGGGSSYTPELIQGFIDRSGKLPVDELWLMDIDPDRLAVVGGFTQRMVAASGVPFKVILCTNQQDAIRQASYVITQFRVGQMEARRRDEYLGKRHGLIGQETTGIGGMAKALRTIPVLLQIARDMEQMAAPGALLANFTNPAGLITEALSQHTKINAVGVCNVPITTSMKFIEALQNATGRQIDLAKTRLNTLGLNHLSWHRGFTVDNEEMWPLLMQLFLEEQENEPRYAWCRHTLEALQMLPNYYLQYYYHTGRKRNEQDSWPPSRAEEVMAVEKQLLDQYAEPQRTKPPEALMQRGGAYYSTAATQLINAHYNGLDEVHVVNISHQGAVQSWPSDWVLEMPAMVSRGQITPLPAEPLPPVCFGLLAQVKSFEQLAIQAAVHGDHNAAYQALLAHPLGPQADRIPEVLADLLETNRQWLPQFFRQAR